MSEFARVLRMAADVVEDFQGKARERYNDQREAGVDSQSVVDALATLTASVAAGVAEITMRPGRRDDCCNGTSAEAATDVAAEVDRAFGRLGLVQESELAALRKRVVDLEARLGETGSAQ
jgi:hypothetical protein